MPIGYNRLGSNGRLGNQMFQYAGLRGIAEYKGFSWVIPRPDNYGASNYGLFDCFKMESVKEENFGFLNRNSVETGCFHYNKQFIDELLDNVNLHDYFQSEKYFENIKDVIRKDFIFKDEILNPCKEIMEDLVDPIFLHVRRGDYVNHQKAHPVCPISYYEKALTYFKEESPVLVFSDDIEWCKSQDFFKGDRFMLSEYTERYPQKCDTNDGKQNALIPYFDMCMMSLCTGGILANSSMSWWGAWLIENPTQPIIAPKRWFGTQYTHYNMNDLIPERWTQIEVD
jgi:hypothetical protein